MIVIDKDKCNGCGNCIEVCPQGAIDLSVGTAQINRQFCIDCGACLDVCPTGALRETVPQFAGSYGEREVNNMMGRGWYDGGYGRWMRLGMGRGFGRGFGRGLGYGMGSGMGRGMGRGFGRGRGYGMGLGMGRGRGLGVGRGLGRGWGTVPYGGGGRQPYYPPYGTWD